MQALYISNKMHSVAILKTKYGIYTSILTQRNKSDGNLLSITAIHFSKNPAVIKITDRILYLRLAACHTGPGHLPVSPGLGPLSSSSSGS